MTSSRVKSEMLPGPERRRRWSAAEKVAMVAETHEPGATVSLVARRHEAPGHVRR
jgi:transposase